MVIAVFAALLKRLTEALVDLIDKRVCVQTIGEVAVADLLLIFVIISLDM